METTEERLAAHDPTLAQMNERFGNIEATLRDMNGRFDSLQAQLATKADRDFVLKLTGGLFGWMTFLIGAAVGIILAFCSRSLHPWPPAKYASRGSKAVSTPS